MTEQEILGELIDRVDAGPQDSLNYQLRILAVQIVIQLLYLLGYEVVRKERK